MKKLIFLLIFCSIRIGFSQNPEEIPVKKTQIGFGKIDFFSIKMPDTNEQNMGFTGIHYNLMMNNWSYAGVGLYGSVTGERGGFFTLGLNLGVKQNITNKLFVDAGLHFGGGGGASAPDGGGAYILPHANLGYNFKAFSATVGWNYINFFDKGEIKNHQLNIALQIPLSFDYTSFDKKETTFSIASLKTSEWNKKSNRMALLLHSNNLSVNKNSQFTDGTAIDGRTIRLAGFELQSYINNNWFYFVKADGAYSGIPAGYMDVFIGAGYHISMNKNRTNIVTKFGVGASGGGGVDTKGGFLLYPDISLEQRIFKNTYLTINKGFIMSLDLHFNASTLGFGLKHYLDKDGIITEKTNINSIKFKGLEAILTQEFYLNASRNGGFTKNMQQISLQFNLFLNKYVFAAGQTSFANFGDAGAYAEGIVGIGVQSNSFFNNKLTAFTQILGGAAGGGGISTGEGFIVKPSIGFNYQLNNNLHLRLAGGYVKAYKGALSSPFINVGINYNFSFLTLN